MTHERTLIPVRVPRRSGEKSQRALILCLPGSGASYFAELMRRGGWTVPKPWFAKAWWGYPKLESLIGRTVNREAIGGSALWPKQRWRPDYELPDEDYSETLALARWWVEQNDAQYDRWVFKNPESLMAWDRIWRRFDWDYVLGIYRHPEDSVRSMFIHAPNHRTGRRRSWVQWGRKIVNVSDAVFRFPEDGAAFCEHLGIPFHDALVPGHPKLVSDDGIMRSQRFIWHRLEKKRCESIPAKRT